MLAGYASPFDVYWVPVDCRLLQNCGIPLSPIQHTCRRYPGHSEMQSEDPGAFIPQAERKNTVSPGKEFVSMTLPALRLVCISQQCFAERQPEQAICQQFFASPKVICKHQKLMQSNCLSCSCLFTYMILRKGGGETGQYMYH